MQIIHRAKVTQYVTLVEYSTNALNYAIMTHIQSGWQPWGSMATALTDDQVEYIQPMVKYEEPK